MLNTCKRPCPPHLLQLLIAQHDDLETSSTKGARCIQCWASLPIAPVVLWHHPSRNSLNRCRSQRDAAFRCTRTSLGMKNIAFFSEKMGLQNGRTFLGQLRRMNFKECTMNFGSIVCHFSPPRPSGFVAHSWTQKHRESGRHGRETSLADQPF